MCELQRSLAKATEASVIGRTIQNGIFLNVVYIDKGNVYSSSSSYIFVYSIVLVYVCISHASILYPYSKCRNVCLCRCEFNLVCSSKKNLGPLDGLGLDAVIRSTLFLIVVFLAAILGCLATT